MKTQVYYKISLAVIVLAITAYYFVDNPTKTSFGIPCLFHSATGLYCPGCGGQRAFYALLHGDILKAFQANLLLFIVLPLIGLKLSEEVTGRKVLPEALYSRRLIIVTVLLLIIFFVIRNIPYEPFTYLIPPKK